MDHVNAEVLYPRLLRRVRAFLVDSVIFVILIFTWMVSLPAFGESSFVVKIAALIVPIMILEPGLVAFTGGTLGHHIMGLRIRDASRDQNIGFFRAAVRAIIRTLLGWLSFIFVLVTHKHQALHDYFTSTVVVLHHPESLPEHEKYVARAEDRAQYKYPTKIRRVAVILFYAFLGVAMLIILSSASLSEQCLNDTRCTPGETTISYLLSALWLISIGLSIVLGWRGLLYGCRRTPLSQNVASDS